MPTIGGAGRPQQRSVSVDDNGMGDMLRLDAERLRILVERHHLHTGSARARALLDDWDAALPRFVKVMPRTTRARSRQLEAERLEPPASPPNRLQDRQDNMGKATGFLEIERHDRTYDTPEARLKHYKEFVDPARRADALRARRRAA